MQLIYHRNLWFRHNNIFAFLVTTSRRSWGMKSYKAKRVCVGASEDNLARFTKEFWKDDNNMLYKKVTILTSINVKFMKVLDTKSKLISLLDKTKIHKLQWIHNCNTPINRFTTNKGLKQFPRQLGEIFLTPYFHW